MTSALQVLANGDKKWFNEFGQLDREDGPAIEKADGTQEYWSKNKYHRGGNLPAIIKPNGDKFYIVDGEYHRTDGPAQELADGRTYYFLNNQEYNKAEFERKVAALKV